jgi:hypothetical protein
MATDGEYDQTTAQAIDLYRTMRALTTPTNNVEAKQVLDKWSDILEYGFPP